MESDRRADAGRRCAGRLFRLGRPGPDTDDHDADPADVDRVISDDSRSAPDNVERSDID